MSRATSLVLVLGAAVTAAACGGDPTPEGACREVLAPGDLVITEIFADADAPSGGSGADEGREWFEIYNASGRALDLAGVSVRLQRSDGSGGRAITLGTLIVAAGEYVVLGNALAELAPAHVDYGYGDDLGDLYNTGGGRLALGCDAELEAVTFDAVVPGASQQYDGSAVPDAAGNDDLTRWCTATPELSSAFEEANLGTPGAANQDCEVIVPGTCVDGDLDAPRRPINPPQPGELVITEVMASPSAVDDALGEWIEVLALADVDLNEVGVDRALDTRDPDLILAELCRPLAAGQRAVLARSSDPAQNGGLPEVAGTFRVTLVGGSAASPGDVQLLVGETVIDAFVWTSPLGDGQSLQVDPSHETAVANDVERVWCDGAATYGDGDQGTPGAANAACEILPAPGFCVGAGGVERPIVAPVAGELVITEVMASPDAVDDAAGEWFEVLALADVDLNGLGLDRAADARNPDVIEVAPCLTVVAGERVVFARSDLAADNGGLPAVAATFGFTLVGGSAAAPGDVRLMIGDTVIDAFVWTQPMGNGVALALDPGLATAADNDTERFWCDATAPYGAGDPPDRGSPGAANDACVIPPPDGFCVDAGGAERAIVAPGPGDLVITEVMASPDAVEDALGEWIEVVATAAVDLNGLGLDRVDDARNPDVLTSAACLPVAAGARVVFARSALTADNGGLEAVVGTFGFTLVGGSPAAPGDVRLLAGETEVDAFVWTVAMANGQSRQLDPDFETAVANDTERFWCDAAAPYGAGDPPDRGTPGGSNDQCVIPPPPGFCVDGGGERAIDLAAAGELVITEVMASPSAVEDALGEWFEVLALADLDLNDLGLDRAGDARAPDLLSSTTCLPVTAGTRMIFTRSADGGLNGGLPPVWGLFGFTLVGGSVGSPGDVRLLVGETVIDAFAWTTPMVDGVSRQLDPDFEAAAANDEERFWCSSTAAYGDGDLGTPTGANADCVIPPPAGFCVDGGLERPIVTPIAGQLLIDEWMPDSALVTDANGEWIELRATADVDLNGLQLGTTALGTTPIVGGGPACVPLAAGARVLLAHSAASGTNGGLPTVDALFTASLTNASGTLQIGFGGVAQHTVTWAASTAGRSIMLDSDGTQCTAPAGVATYNGTDVGTPRATNTPPECP